MDWFWNRWFFGEGDIDLGITGADKTTDGYVFKIENKSLKPLPVDLTLTYDDGSTEKAHWNIGVWEKPDLNISLPFKTSKKIKKAVLGSTYVPDKNDYNNILFVK